MRSRRIELLSHPWQGRVLPLNQPRYLFITNMDYSIFKDKMQFCGFNLINQSIFVNNHNLCILHIVYAPMVKWISRRSSEPLLGVRIPLGAQKPDFVHPSKPTAWLAGGIRKVFHYRLCRLKSTRDGSREIPSALSKGVQFSSCRERINLSYTASVM